MFFPIVLKISISWYLMCNICGVWPEKKNNPPSQTSGNIRLHNAHCTLKCRSQCNIQTLPCYLHLSSTGNHEERRSELQVWTPSPGYGTLPLVTSSVSRMPNDHTSDLMVNFPYSAASGAVHFIGNLAPKSNHDALVQIFRQQMFNVD